MNDSAPKAEGVTTPGGSSFSTESDQIKQVCPTCHGNGWSAQGSTPAGGICGSCRGSGEVSSTRRAQLVLRSAIKEISAASSEARFTRSVGDLLASVDAGHGDVHEEVLAAAVVVAEAWLGVASPPAATPPTGEASA